MARIRYWDYGNIITDHKLAQDISELVNKSFRDANGEFSTYSEEQSEAFLRSYTPEAILQNPLEPIVSVFAYIPRIIRNKKIIGSGFLAHGNPSKFVRNDSDAFAYGLYVDPKYQNHGIGRTIVDKYVGHAKKNGIIRIHAFTTKFPGNLEHHLKWGFRHPEGKREPFEVNVPFSGKLLGFYEVVLDLI